MKNIPLLLAKNGTGKPVILIHGFLSGSSLWGEFKKKLASYHLVYTIDLPAHGNNTKLGDWYELKDIAEEIILFCTTNNIEKPTLIGHSLGGYICMEMLLQNFKASSVILLNSSPFEDTLHKKQQRKKELILIQKGKGNMLKQVLIKQAVLDNPTHSKQLLRDCNKIANTTLEKYITALISRNSYTKIAHTCTYIIGKNDPARFESENLQIHYVNTGHYSFLEAPQECFEIIKKITGQ